MAATVTIEEVKAMGVAAPDFVIQGFIDTANSADACIDGLGLSDDQEKALQAGCDDYDTKPVDLPRLLEKMSRLIPSD